MTMVQIPEKTLTIAEFLQRPETKPATEYIDGQLVQKPMGSVSDMLLRLNKQAKFQTIDK